MTSRYTITLGVLVALFASAEAGAQIFVNRTTIPQTYPIDPDLIINAVNYGGGYEPGGGDPVTLTMPAAVLDVDPGVTESEAGGSLPAALGSTESVAPGPAVPEPSTLVMAVAALTAAMVMRALRRQRRGR